MDIISMYAGFGIAYLIVVTLLLLSLIFSKIHVSIKGVMILISLWYGLVMFYAPSNFMGWPTNDKLPYEFVVFSYIVQEPSSTDDGGIYLLVISTEEYYTNKTNLFTPNHKVKPRFHKMPYDKEFHKNLNSNQPNEGAYLIIKSPCNKPEFRVDDPRSSLTK